MRMRQSIAEIEDAFFEEIEEDRERRERLRRRAERRQLERQAKRTHRHGSMRFFLLVMVLLGTAVFVTWAMFATLYYVLSPS
jgi:membrane glycosyltransferase